jgi:hypothetical protein
LFEVTFGRRSCFLAAARLACHSCNICKFFKSCRAKVQIAR